MPNPVLYLLHGMHGDNNSWFRDQRARDVLDRNIFSGEAVEMVVVSPNAGGGDPAVYQNGYFNMPGWEYEDFFFNELMPYVEKRYRASVTTRLCFHCCADEARKAVSAKIAIADFFIVLGFVLEFSGRNVPILSGNNMQI